MRVAGVASGVASCSAGNADAQATPTPSRAHPAGGVGAGGCRQGDALCRAGLRAARQGYRPCVGVHTAPGDAAAPGNQPACIALLHPDCYYQWLERALQAVTHTAGGSY